MGRANEGCGEAETQLNRAREERGRQGWSAMWAPQTELSLQGAGPACWPQSTASPKLQAGSAGPPAGLPCLSH